MESNPKDAVDAIVSQKPLSLVGGEPPHRDPRADGNRPGHILSGDRPGPTALTAPGR